MGLQIRYTRGKNSYCCELMGEYSDNRMRICGPLSSNQQEVSWEVAQFHWRKRSGNHGYSLFDPPFAGEDGGTWATNTTEENADSIKVKRLKVQYWEDIEPHCTEKYGNSPPGSNKDHDSHLINVQEALLEWLDKVALSIKASSYSPDERNWLDGLRDLKIKSHLHTLELKIELLSTKHENIQMSMDNLAIDLMSARSGRIRKTQLEEENARLAPNWKSSII